MSEKLCEVKRAKENQGHRATGKKLKEKEKRGEGEKSVSHFKGELTLGEEETPRRGRARERETSNGF